MNTRTRKRENEPIPQKGVRMPRGSKDYIPPEERELRPLPGSGWRELVPRAEKIRGHIDAIAYSCWYRSGVMAVSALELAEAPDGKGDTIHQWHISFSGRGRRSTDVECRQALVSFGMLSAEEDNHHPGGGARHFWLPIDPARRVECECKSDEKVIVEPDGYRSTTPADGPCSGCELAAIKRTMGVAEPCPLHPEGP